jgi:hypothetical protein
LRTTAKVLLAAKQKQMPELVDSTQVRAVAVVGRRAALIGVKNIVNVLVKIQTEPCERVTPSLQRRAPWVVDKSGSVSLWEQA